MKKISILFSGRGSNAESIVSKISHNKLNFKIKKIICNNKKSSGIELIKKYKFNVDVLDINSYGSKDMYNVDLANLLDPKDNDLLVLCGYMNKIPDQIIKSYRGQIINIHPSILPKYKGLNTHEKAIFNHDLFHGCSTHFVTSEIDCGPVIAQYLIKIEHNDDSISISNKLLPIEHKLFFKTLKMIENNKIMLIENKIFYNSKILKSPIIYT